MASITTPSSGYRVRPSALTEAANELSNEAQQLSTAAAQIDSATLTPQAFGSLPESGQVAQSHNALIDKAGQATGAAQRRLTTLATGLTNSAANYVDGDQKAAAGYRSLLDGGGSGSGPTGAGPGGGGSGGGGPFASQIAANRPKVAAALTAEQSHLKSLQDQLAALQAEDRADPFGDDLSRGLNYWQQGKVAGQIDTANNRIALYQSIIANNRQILDFDPSGNGRIVELIGHIGPDTKNVGVLVPGAFTNMANFDKYARDAASFVTASPNGDLAMVAWADGPFPQGLVPAAADPSYSQSTAPDLAAFSHQLRDQVNAAAGPGNDVQITYAGHSYGGAVVGLAETHGLDANRVMYLESPGVGHDVWTPGDLHETQSNVRRYAMTAPGDPIENFQGLQLFGWGHGADPNTFPGVTTLSTGNYADGTPITGLAAHNGVLTTGSDAWKNMYGVFTGGPVTALPPRPPIQPYPIPPPYFMP